MGSVVSKTRAERNRDPLIQTIDEHQSGINCMSLSDDTSLLATGSDDCQIRLWSTKTTPVQCLSVLIGHTEYITHIQIVQTFLISASADKTIRKWDVINGECLIIFNGHTSMVNRILCTGNILLSTSYDRTARSWDLTTGACLQEFIGHTHGVFPVYYLQSKHNDDDFEQEMNIYTKDMLITGSQDLTARVWALNTGDCLKILSGHTGGVLCLAVDSQGKILFTGSADNSIRVWDIRRAIQLRVFDQHQGSVIQLIVAHKLLYSISTDHTARCWVIDVGDCTRIYKGHHHSVSCIQIEEGFVYTGCGDAVIRCFEARTGHLKRSLKSHALAINCIQIANDRLFSGSVDGTIKVWDLTDLRESTTNQIIVNSQQERKGQEMV